MARREALARLQDRTFVVSTLVLLGLVAAAVTVPLLLSRGGAAPLTLGTVGARAADLASSTRPPGVTVRQLTDATTAERLVREGAVDAALLPSGRDPSQLELVADRRVPTELEDLVAMALLARTSLATPTVRLLEPASRDADLVLGTSVAFAMVFLLASFLFGMSIAQSVVEEKQTRIVEILVAAIPVRVLLAGKVLANTAVALGQMVLFVAVGLAGASLAGQAALVRSLLGSSRWFLLFFLLGFAMLGCLWAAAGSVAGRQEDLQATTAPLQLLLFVPFVAATYVSSRGSQLTALSYFPFTAPIAMPRRLVLHDAAAWEAVVAAGGVLLTGTALVALAVRVYERSILVPGGRGGWAAALGRRQCTRTLTTEGV